MSFFRKTTVKTPRKTRACDLCGKEIKGECIYAVSKFDDCIISGYFHVECLKLADLMCSECPYSLYCKDDRRDCFLERKDR